MPRIKAKLLRDPLKRVTASVVVAGKPTGTAVFITDTILLTCEHVVAGGGHVEITTVGCEPRPATLLGEPDQELDIAFLQLSADSNSAPQPCAVLDDQLDEGEYLVAGFPREDSVARGLEMFRVNGHPNEGMDGEEQLLQLEAGKVITWGMSGGPLINLRSGAVVGVVRFSHDPTDAVGGGAIPLSRIASSHERVRQLLRRSPAAVREWRDTLGPEIWRSVLGRSWNLEGSLDLRISGHRTQWKVQVGDGSATCDSLRGSDLGEDVAEALFRWAAQRRRIHGREEVELLGRLLARGIMPSTVQSHMHRIAGADSVHVRLHVESGNDLADIPWELAAIPGQPTTFLAADTNYVFSRLIEGLGGSPARHDSRDEAVHSVHVLAALCQPRGWSFSNVYGRRGDKPYIWPKLEDIESSLRKSIDGDPMKLTLRVCPQPTEITRELESGVYSVFHYIGFGQIDDGEPWIAFVDDTGEQVVWTEAASLFAPAAEAGVRVIILELMLPPIGQEFDPLTPSSVEPLLEGGIEAVVMTQQPVHVLQCKAFNASFYADLKRGGSIVRATQQARKDLKVNKPVEDAAGFGWFTVMTRTLTEISLVSPDAGDRIVGRGAGVASGHGPFDRSGQGGRGGLNAFTG